jgi:hypothetical protein
LICAPKKFENPARLFDLSENLSVIVQTDTRLTCVRFGMCVIHRWYTSIKPSVNPSVIVAQSRKCFSTLCEIPTGYSRRWRRRWLWHNLVNFFQLSVKYQRVIFCRWLWHNPVNVFQLSVKYRRVIFCQCTCRWNRKFFLFFV